MVGWLLHKTFIFFLKDEGFWGILFSLSLNIFCLDSYSLLCRSCCQIYITPLLFITLVLLLDTLKAVLQINSFMKVFQNRVELIWIGTKHSFQIKRQTADIGEKDRSVNNLI